MRYLYKIVFLAVASCPLALFGKPLKVNVSAESAILINADTGAILYEKNAHAPAYPASTTKIASTLLILEKKKGSLDEIATASADDVGYVMAHLKRANNYSKHPPHRLEHDGTHISLKVGEEMSIRNLLYGSMMVSGNDAANLLARHVSGSVPKFMEELDRFLKAHGICETSFLNPHGLHHPNHYTTAYDMAMITRLALKSPDFKEIVKTARYTRPQTNKQNESTWVNFNKLVTPGQYYYSKAIGIKTGYYSLAGHTLVAAAEHEGRVLIAVLLKVPDRQQKFRDPIALFEAAFAEKKVGRTLFTAAYDQFSQPMKGAKNLLEAALEEDFKLEYFPSEEPEFKSLLVWNTLKLPIAKGQPVGEIRLVSPSGGVIKKAPLVATKDVSKTFWYRVMETFECFAALPGKKIGLGLIAIVLGGAAVAVYKRGSRSKRSKK